MSKSKQISLLAENVSISDFDSCAAIIAGVLDSLDGYVEDGDEEADRVEPLEPDRKKVTFADVADVAISKHNFPDKYNSEEAAKKEQEMQVVKSLLRSIFEEDPKSKQQDKIELKVTQPQGSSHFQQFGGGRE